MYATSSDCHDGSMQQLIDDLEDISDDSEDETMRQLIHNIKLLIENSSGSLNLPTTPYLCQPRSIFKIESPLCIASEYKNLTIRLPPHQAAQNRSPASVTATGEGHQDTLTNWIAAVTSASSPYTTDKQTTTNIVSGRTPYKADNLYKWTQKSNNIKMKTTQ